VQIFSARRSQRTVVEGSTTVEVATYDSSDTQFDTVAIEGSTYSGSECDTVDSVSQTQSGTSLSVTVDVSRDTSVAGCETSEGGGGGLPVWAIVVIAIGGVLIVAVGLTVLLVCCRRRELAKKNAMFMSSAYQGRESEVQLTQPH